MPMKTWPRQNESFQVTGEHYYGFCSGFELKQGSVIIAACDREQLTEMLLRFFPDHKVDPDNFTPVHIFRRSLSTDSDFERVGAIEKEPS